MGKKISDKVTWVGKIDWELKKFHGDEYSIRKGSSYNSFLIRDEKTVLIDTVWLPFGKEFVSKLKEEVDLKTIDYIVMDHGEVDHSGALLELMREIPDTPIYCTKNAVISLKGQYHQDWNFVPVKTGDTLEIGENTLTFIEAPMLHWPDTMFTYVSGEQMLISMDAFGQHLASETLYNDTVDKAEMYAEALKYYANIIAPFGMMVTSKIKEILGMNLPIKMICPSHGVMWREDPMQIVNQYLLWADAYKENQITIVYDTMWNATRKMAEWIAEGIHQFDPQVTIKLMNASKYDKNDIATAVFCSKAVLFGSSTINNGFLYSIGGILEMIKGLKMKGKKAAAFGSYGWSGEAAKEITKMLAPCGFEVINEGLRIQWVPDEAGIAQCMEFGKEFAKSL